LWPKRLLATPTFNLGEWKMERFEIRTNKGKAVESLTMATTKEQAIARIKELKATEPKQEYELVRVTTLYDTANPPVEIEF
jgi:hypothetical protein